MNTHDTKVRNITAGRLEESFLMVPGSASAMRQGPSQSINTSATGYAVDNIDDKFQQLAKIFEIASGETRVMLGTKSLFCEDLL